MIHSNTSLSVLIPTYNEGKTIGKLLQCISQQKKHFPELQVIVIDDGSTDATARVVRRFHWVEYQRHDYNQGKTAAIRTGLQTARNRYVLIQDADLEYSPSDWHRLLKIAIQQRADVVYGSRRLQQPAPQSASIWFYLGGMSINWLTNWLYQAHLTDVPTGYKLFERSLLQTIPITTYRFEFCPEVTARLLKKNHSIIEVPISYQPRSVAEGKKIGWQDYWSAVWTLLAVKWGWR